MKDEWAKITEIEDVYSIKIYQCGLFTRLRKKHRYYIDIFGKEHCEFYVDRIALEGTNKVILNGCYPFIVNLYTIKQLIMGKKFKARITEYPKNEYSVVWIHPENMPLSDSSESSGGS